MELFERQSAHNCWTDGQRLAAGGRSPGAALAERHSLSSSVKVMTAVHVSSIIWQACTSPPPLAFLEKWKPSLSARLSGSIRGRSETKIRREQITESICRATRSVNPLMEVRDEEAAFRQVLVPPPVWAPPAGPAEPPP